MAENKIDEDVQDVRNQLILGNRHLSIPLSRFGLISPGDLVVRLVEDGNISPIFLWRSQLIENYGDTITQRAQRTRANHDFIRVRS
jgi:hypothetical protein